MKRLALAMAMAALLAGCGAPENNAPETKAPENKATASTPGAPCNDSALSDTRVEFTNSVGGAINGYLLGTGTTGIVLANELQKNACSWRPYAKQLAGRGYRVLAFDFNSDQTKGYVSGSTDNGDVVAAAAFLRQRGVQKVVLIGASRGGTAVLVAATAIEPAVAGVISLSGPASFNGMVASAAVPKLTMPVLYLAAELDRPFASDAQTLYNATPKGLGTLVVLEGTGHGEQFPLGEAASSYRATSTIDDFLKSNAPVA